MCNSLATNHPTSKARRAFSIPEMLATIAIIVIVISLLLPGFGKSRESVWVVECSNNLHQTSLAMNNFKVDHTRLPNASEVIYGLDQYYSGGVDQNIFRHCPADEDFDGTSYGVNPCVSKLNGESGKVVMLDAYEPFVFFEGTSSAAWLDTIAPRHFGKNMNVLFYGGNVESRDDENLNPYDSDEVLTSKWKPTQKCDVTGDELGCGCTGTYYTGLWSGDTATRIDTTLHMPFGGAFFGFDYWDIPLEGTNSGGWDTGSFGSGTWTATLKAPVTETFTFYLACDNEAWLIVNGQQILHRSTGGAGGVTSYQASSTVSLVAGEPVDIEVRLREHSPGFSPSHVSVKWESPSTPQGVIPCAAMRP